MRRLCALILALVTTQACSQWQTNALEPANLSREPRVLVTRASGQKMELQFPTVSGDSLRGRQGNGLPLADIHRVEVRRADGFATTMAITLGVAAVVAIAVVVVTVCDFEYTC